MDSHVSKELTAKINRINGLKDLGLNTPLMYYLPMKSDDMTIIYALAWCAKIGHKAYNIRTYAYNKSTSKETVNSVHYTDIPRESLKEILTNLTSQKECMIDAEIPDNGRISGCIIVERSPMGRPERFIIDYCIKPIRAMVRDVDKNFKITNDEFIRLTVDDIEQVLPSKHFAEIIREACRFKLPAILEWTYFSEPTGVKNKNLVFWEWRKYDGGIA